MTDMGGDVARIRGAIGPGVRSRRPSGDPVAGQPGNGVFAAVMATLGLFVVLGLGSGLLIGAIVAACLVPLWGMLLGGGRHGASGLVYGYLFAGLLGGVFAAHSLIPGEDERLGAIVAGYGAFLLGLWVATRLGSAPATSDVVPSTLSRHAERRLLAALGASFAVGCAGWFLVVGTAFDLGAFLADPQSSRESVRANASISTTAVTAFRMLIVSGLLGYALRCLAPSRELRWLGTAAAVASGVLLFTYGGRLLPVLMLLAILLFRHVAVRPLHWKRVVPVAIAVVAVATWYAGYRYYAFFGDSFSPDKFGATLARQVGGDVVDATRVSAFFGVGDVQARDTLLQQMRQSTIPAIVRGPLEFQEYRSFGQFASGALGQSKVGGIRVGVSGEAVLAFGILGAAVVGALVGGILRAADALTAARRIWLRALGAFTVAMTVFVLITGAANLLSALMAVSVGALFLRSGLGSVVPADAEPDPPATVRTG